MSWLEQLRIAINGSPASATHPPSQEGLLAAFETLEILVQGLSGDFLMFETKALMDADTTRSAGTQARVWNDPTPANNRVYVYDGAAWNEDTDYYDSIAAIVQPLVDDAEAAQIAAESARDTIATNEETTIALLGATDPDRTMQTGPFTWENEPGWVGHEALTDIDTSHAGKMLLTFTTGVARYARLPDIFLVPGKYEIQLKGVKVESGTPCPLRIGIFTSGPTNAEGQDILPTTTATDYTVDLTVSTLTYLGIGALASNSTDCTVTFDEIVPVRISNRTRYLEDRATIKAPMTFSLDGWLNSIDISNKRVIHGGYYGDSLQGYESGGPVADAADESPMRLRTRSPARRFYDELPAAYKPTWRRGGHADITATGGWSTVSDMFEPALTERMQRATSAGATQSLPVPDGKTEVIIRLRKDAGAGSVTFTLNGGSIAAYGPTDADGNVIDQTNIDLNRTDTNVSDLGNAFFYVHFTNLPAGNNTILMTTVDTNPVDFWGYGYNDDVCVIVDNMGHSGHTLDLMIDQGHIQAEIVENNLDFLRFQLPVMNEASSTPDTNTAVINMRRLIALIGSVNTLFVTPWPMGLNPAGTTNYYANNVNPDMEEFCNALMIEAYRRGYAGIDIFGFFKQKIEAAGDTLLTGKWVKNKLKDGQHPIEGVDSYILQQDHLFTMLATANKELFEVPA